MNFSHSLLAAKLQEIVSKRREKVGLSKEITDHIPLPEAGRLLDVGTGTGLQLREISKRKPDLHLYGLDMSACAIQVADRYFPLQNLPIFMQVKLWKL